MSWLSFIIRSLRLRAFSSCVTTLMVGVSVAILLVLLSMRSSAQQSFRRGTGNMHLLVSADASPLVAVLNGVFYANPPANPLLWQQFQSLKESFPWEWCIPTQLGDSYRGAPVMATTTEFFSRFQPAVGESWQFAEGVPFASNFQVVAGAQAARDFGLHLGDRIALTHGAWSGEGGHEHADHLYEVVGVLAPTASAHDRALFTDLESTWIIHAEDRAEREHDDHVDHDGHDHAHVDAHDLTDEDRKITGAMLRLPTRPGRDATAAMQGQFDRLRRDTSITVAMPADQVDKLFRIVGDIDSLFIALGIAVLLSSSVAILLALYNSMDLRRRQVAIIRVLGASQMRVFMLILSESALIGLAGSAAGLAMAHFAAMAAADALRAKVGLVIDPTLEAGTLAAVTGGAIALACLAGVIPAARAYRTSVADNLRPLG
ncbi:MAG: ABC transporter permease [Phycisphaerales bacterium]|nr:ABC transporter permease [Phycisphaerales bacterium]